MKAGQRKRKKRPGMAGLSGKKIQPGKTGLALPAKEQALLCGGPAKIIYPMSRIVCTSAAVFHKIYNAFQTEN